MLIADKLKLSEEKGSEFCFVKRPDRFETVTPGIIEWTGTFNS